MVMKHEDTGKKNLTEVRQPKPEAKKIVEEKDDNKE